MTKEKRHYKSKKAILAASFLLSALCFSGCGLPMKEVGQSSDRKPKKPDMTGYTEQLSEEHKDPDTSAADDREENEPKKEQGKGSDNKEHIIENVPHIYQCDKYPTGCESVAATALMQYYGVAITTDEFIDDYLPCADLPYKAENGCTYCESPWYYFIGDPRSCDGFGCYATVIEDAMSEALPEEFQVVAEYGTELSYAAEKYIANDEPVMIWATIEMQPSWQGKSWIVPDGEKFTFISPEHALIMVGYDDEYYYFCDSTKQEEITAYLKYDCENAYSSLGAQMIRIEERNKTR